MKRKIITTALILLASATLALYVSAQNQTEKEQDSAIPSSPGIFVRGNGVRPPRTDIPPEKGIILLRTVFREDGTLQGFRTMPPGSNPEAVLTNKIRIEMLDGSVQEIALSKVKKITVE